MSSTSFLVGRRQPSSSAMRCAVSGESGDAEEVFVAADGQVVAGDPHGGALAAGRVGHGHLVQRPDARGTLPETISQ